MDFQVFDSDNNIENIDCSEDFRLFDFDTKIDCTNTDFTYTILDNFSKPPYYCSCAKASPSGYPNRQKFQRHMKKHTITIPKKRKAEETFPDEDHKFKK